MKIFRSLKVSNICFLKVFTERAWKMGEQNIPGKSFSVCMRTCSCNIISNGRILLVWVTHKYLTLTDRSKNLSLSSRGLLRTWLDYITNKATFKSITHYGFYCTFFSVTNIQVISKLSLIQVTPFNSDCRWNYQSCDTQVSYQQE